MNQNTQNTKETIKKLLTIVKGITPALEVVAKDTEFEIVITNDSEGLSFSATLGWNPLQDDIDIAEVVREVPIGENEPLSMQGAEATMIRKALERCNGDKRKAAAQLGISERTLNRKIKEYRIGKK